MQQENTAYTMPDPNAANRRNPLLGAPLVAACGVSFVLGAVLMVLPLGSGSSSEGIDEYVTYFEHNRGEPFSALTPPEGLSAEMVALGDRLFHEPRLSSDKTVSCASCHDLASGGDDGLPRSIGVDKREGVINAPTVFNASFNVAQFWDGRAATLEEQVDGPIHNPLEMNSDWAEVLRLLSEDPDYAQRFRDSFGGPPTVERVRIAIATFERSLTTPDAPFDLWLVGDDDALSSDARAGLALFKKHGCVSCHQGQNVGGNLFQRLGIMREYFTHDRQLTDSDLGRFNVTQREIDRYVFRVPSLRNVELTAPYFHDGSAKTLTDAVHAMLEYQVGVKLEDSEVAQIVEFLRTMTGKLPAGST